MPGKSRKTVCKYLKHRMKKELIKMDRNREFRTPSLYSPVSIRRVKERPEALRFISDAFNFSDNFFIDSLNKLQTKSSDSLFSSTFSKTNHGYYFDKKIIYNRIRQMTDQQIKSLILINIYYEKNYTDKSLGIRTRYEPGYPQYEESLFLPISKLFSIIQTGDELTLLHNLNIIIIWNNVIRNSNFHNYLKFHIDKNQLDRISFDPKNNIFESCFNNFFYCGCAIKAMNEGLLNFNQFFSLCQDGRLDTILKNHKYIFPALRENLLTGEYLKHLRPEHLKIIIDLLKSKENIKILKTRKSSFRISVLLFFIGGATLTIGALYCTISQYDHIPRLPMIILFTTGIIMTIAAIMTNTSFRCTTPKFNYHQVLNEFIRDEEHRMQDFYEDRFQQGIR